jgi:hypothetical protein
MKRLGFLLIITSMLTGWQTYWLIMWAVWGAPIHPVQYLALLGSVIQIISGILLLLGKIRGVWLAIFGLGLSWCFFAPALFETLAHLSKNVLREFYVLFPSCLLLLSSLLAIGKLFELREAQRKSQGERRESRR